VLGCVRHAAHDVLVVAPLEADLRDLQGHFVDGASAINSSGNEAAANASSSAILASARRAAAIGGPAAVKATMAAQGFRVDDVWCGDFAAYVVKNAGGTPPAGYPGAVNWRKWGQPDPTPHPGDIAVRKDEFAYHGYGHVNIVEGYDEKTGMFHSIGGNQGATRHDYPASQYTFRRAADDERMAVDGHRVHTVKVEGSGKLTANINAPPGTDVTLQGGGLFKKTEMARQVQMAPARPAAGIASVQGKGSPL
jgi:hypothetical protein